MTEATRPTLGANPWTKGAVRGITRWIAVIAVMGTLRASDASAQNTLASILPGNDTTARKSSVSPDRPKSTGFARDQLEYDRVFEAHFEKRFEVKKLFRDHGIEYPAEQIFLRAFKRERTLELWVRPAGQSTFVLLKSYEICALSEAPGPKLMRGDLQTPEGFYYINNFNPQSGYHLSLGVNYPNEADRIRNGDDRPLGGDIFIHGGCKTAGCMALTDESIKELYLIAMEARDYGQARIPVHIFPARLTNDALAQLARVFEKEDPAFARFWSNLKTGYDFFEKHRKLPIITVDQRGRYAFESPDPEPLLGTPVAAQPGQDD
ncbi:MAG: L,D-transpeptidase family protein [Gemmatimonadota bacterium]